MIKRREHISLTLVLLGIISSSNICSLPLIKQDPSEVLNKLNWIDITKNNLATQVMFDFKEPIYVQKKLDAKKRELLLSFPGISLDNFNKKHIVAKLNQLKAYGLVDQIIIQEKKLSIPNVELSITFAPFLASAKKALEPNNKEDRKPNRLLIKWSTIEDPNRLILDIYSTDSLEQVKQKNNIILQAHHNPHLTHERRQLHSLRSKKKTRIVIDPGHGGHDHGTVGINKVKEKDIALLVARNARQKLSDMGYTTLLTRNEDKAMSLSERAELAELLQADLFISIHVNSWPFITEAISGIETHYLSSKHLLSSSRKGGFFFVNTKPNDKLIERANYLTDTNLFASKELASSIQNQLISYLNSQNIPAKNRGIKPTTSFRNLYKTTVPTALIEIGFLTNQEEATRLSKPQYQNLIAQGICRGIANFLQSRETEAKSSV